MFVIKQLQHIDTQTLIYLNLKSSQLFFKQALIHVAS